MEPIHQSFYPAICRVRSLLDYEVNLWYPTVYVDRYCRTPSYVQQFGHLTDTEGASDEEEGLMAWTKTES